MRSASSARADWFSQPAGQALLASEAPLVARLLRERPAQPWLWLAPTAQAMPAGVGPGWLLHGGPGDWHGALRCGDHLPLASGSVGTIVLQHLPGSPARHAALLGACARLLVSGGHLCVLSLNPLSPYRMRWQGRGLDAAEPLVWRRRLRALGLSPEPVSVGVGPVWRMQAVADTAQGAGLRAAWLLFAQKRRIPLTPLRRRELRLAQAGAFRAQAMSKQVDEAG